MDFSYCISQAWVACGLFPYNQLEYDYLISRLLIGPYVNIAKARATTCDDINIGIITGLFVLFQGSEECSCFFCFPYRDTFKNLQIKIGGCSRNLVRTLTTKTWRQKVSGSLVMAL